MGHMQCHIQPLGNGTNSSKTVPQTCIKLYIPWNSFNFFCRMPTRFVLYFGLTYPLCTCTSNLVSCNFHKLRKHREHLAIFHPWPGSYSCFKPTPRPRSNFLFSENRTISATFWQMSAVTGRLYRILMCFICVINIVLVHTFH